jgi:hypothetical protein
MLRFIITLVLLNLLIAVSAQKVFSVEYPNQADVKVFVVKYENQADLKVFKVKYENQADLKIFFVEYENQAGWRKKKKMHLMY